jgi:hypothetical protein
MALCQAITLTDYRPCKNLARHGHETCSSHKKFFQRDYWIKTFVKGNNRHHDTVLLGYTSEDSSMYRLESHVRHMLTSEKIKVTEEDVASLPARDAFVDIFLILCQLPYVDPNWNKRLVLQTVSFYFQVSRHLIGFQLSQLQRIRMGPLIQNSHMGFARTLKFMLKVRDMREKTAALTHHPDTTPFDQIFPTFFTGYDGSHSWYSDELLAEMIVPPNVSLTYFQVQILPLLKQNARQLRQDKKTAMDPIKEEIVAAVYHPRHVERWLEIGGHELLDMMF